MCLPARPPARPLPRQLSRPLARLLSLLLSVPAGLAGLTAPIGLTGLTGLMGSMPLSAWAQAEAVASPAPARVGRVAVREGLLWRYDPDERQWLEAERNLPLTAGDRVASDRGGYAELRIGSTTLALDADSELAFERLDDAQVRVRVLRGSIALRLRSNDLAPEFALGTDDAWLRPLHAGLYRIQRDAAMSEATSWRGTLQLEGPAEVTVDSGRRLQIWRDGPQLRTRLLAAVDDAFAARVLAAAGAEDRRVQTEPVSPEMTGAEDLARYGRWEVHPEYGAVWSPSSVAPDWEPYRDGRWTWVLPWGWTWVDTAPWGFAPFHYGRWLQWRARWFWAPGPYVPRPIFTPGWHAHRPAPRPDRPHFRPLPPERRHVLPAPGPDRPHVRPPDRPWDGPRDGHRDGPRDWTRDGPHERPHDRPHAGSPGWDNRQPRPLPPGQEINRPRPSPWPSPSPSPDRRPPPDRTGERGHEHGSAPLRTPPPAAELQPGAQRPVPVPRSSAPPAPPAPAPQGVQARPGAAPPAPEAVPDERRRPPGRTGSREAAR